MATKIRPLHDRVIVKRIEEEEKTKGGIIIPDTAKEKPQEGKVVAVGPGKYEDGKLIPLGVKMGDKILFGKYSGTEIKLDGEEHLIMREDDILGVVELGGDKAWLQRKCGLVRMRAAKFCAGLIYWRTPLR